ncbi:MAG: hypothetical protein ACYDIE_04725 [Candidatus Krumholzibacteriia bacterium]
MNRILASLVLTGLLAAAAPAVCAPESAWNSGFSAEQIYTANVFGTDSSPDDAIVDGRAWAGWAPTRALRFEATGRLVRFFANPTLDHGYLGGGLNFQWASPGHRHRYVAGASGSLRRNGELYSLYDYREGGVYASGKRYFTPAFSCELRADLMRRLYPEAPLEDALKAWLSARLSRSLPSRTSLALTGRVGWKRYASGELDATGALPRAAIWEGGLQGAQSISARFALRGWWTHSELFQSVDSARELAAFENPLLDEFSAAGDRVGAALKVILPWNCTAEMAGERSRLTYPGRPPLLYDPVANLFLVAGDESLALGTGARRDTSSHLRFGLDKRVNLAGGTSGMLLRAGAEWTDQSSNDLYWTWQGWAVNAGASLEF